MAMDTIMVDASTVSFPCAFLPFFELYLLQRAYIESVKTFQ